MDAPGTAAAMRSPCRMPWRDPGFVRLMGTLCFRRLCLLYGRLPALQGLVAVLQRFPDIGILFTRWLGDSSLSYWSPFRRRWFHAISHLPGDNCSQQHKEAA